MFDDLSPGQQDFVIKQYCLRKLDDYSDGMGTFRDYPIGALPAGYSPPELRPGEEAADPRPKRRVKCVYSPTLVDLCYDAFDCVTTDEGVRMKGEYSQTGIGLRQLDPLYRAVMTATPIKNRLPDLFWLAWWAAGGSPNASARFPYSNADSGTFSETFLIQEQTNGRRKKATAEVCNVHRLWKLFGPLILRRRKQDCGEDIVPRVKQIIRCKMGTEQKRVYEYHMKATYVDRHGRKAVGSQLQALRQAAVAPASENLEAQPSGSYDKDSHLLPHRSTTNYIPKLAAVLTLVRDILQRGEQVCVFAAFNEPNDFLAAKLREAGVRHSIMDGRTTPKKRGALAALFKSGRFPNTVRGLPLPVALAGQDSMAEGHSFHLCNNVILYAYSWAFDKLKQCLDRVWRLNSAKPINVYVVFCDGTIDHRLEHLAYEKSDSVELVLDGQLIGERAEEVSFAQLLELAQTEFKAGTDTVDESTLLAEWPSLRDELRTAQLQWDSDIVLPEGRGQTFTPSIPQSDVRECVRNPQLLAPSPPANVIPFSQPVPKFDAWLTRFRERERRLAALK